MKRKIAALLLTSVVITAFILFLAFPDISRSAASDALTYSARSVVPSLFCIMALSKFAVSSGGVDPVSAVLAPASRFMRLSKSETSCFIAGNLGGFPGGAAIASDEAKRSGAAPRSAAALCAVSNNVSPGFMISYAGAAILGSAARGLAIWLIQLLSSMIVCRFARKRIKNECRVTEVTTHRAPLAQSFCDSVKDAALSCIYVSAFITFFAVLGAFYDSFSERLSLPAVITVLIKGMFELTAGCRTSVALGDSARFIIVAALASSSGVCVIFQSLPYLLSCHADIGLYLRLKTFQAALCAASSALYSALFLREPFVTAAKVGRTTQIPYIISLVIIIVFFGVLLASSRRRGNKNLNKG